MAANRRGRVNALRALLAAFLGMALLIVGTSTPQATVRGGSATGMDPDRAAALTAQLGHLRIALNVPGLSLAIRLPDKTVWTAVSGLAKRAPAARTLTPNTAFAAASITKTFVGALVMQEVQSGVMKLADPVSRWLPSYPNGAAIRIDQLLSHTSGLYDYFDNPSYTGLVFGRPTHVWTLPEILRLVKLPIAAPGGSYDYSNTNYVLLGKIVRRATGQTVGSLIRSRLIGPLQLSRTAFQDVPPQLDSAQGYMFEKGHWLGFYDGTAYRPNTSAATVAFSAAAILATPSDLVRWGHALYAEASVVTLESVTAMTTFNDGDYGLGTERFYSTNDPATQQPLWGHTGSFRGYQAQLWYMPFTDVTIALMSNRGGVSTRPAIQALLATLLAPTPSDSPSPSPSDSPSPSPSPSDSPSPSPSPDLTPEPTPSPEITPQITPEITPEPDTPVPG